MARRITSTKPQESTPEVQLSTEETPETITPTQNAEADFPFGTLATTATDLPTPSIAPEDGISETKTEGKPGIRPHIRSWSRDFVLGYQILLVKTAAIHR